MDSSFLALINLVVASLVGFLCMPLLLGKIRMNQWYGMRVSAAFRSNENWYRINSWGARCFIAWSVVLALLSICILLSTSLNQTIGKADGFFAMIYLIPVYQTWRFSTQL
tara:strand:+ start:13845 stop:14174 length:330 start_codon:yes stop_codon:yes gene_type:complete